MKSAVKILMCTIISTMIFLSGCTQKSQDTIIQFASWGSKSEIDILKPILNDFEKSNPDIKIDFLHIPQNYFQKIHLLFASNTAPDVIFINNLYLPIYANAGMLDEITPEKISTDGFYEKSLDALSFKGKLYAVPRDVSNLVIYYNKNLFDKYHVNYPQKDWTLDDFLETALKLTHRPDVFGISFEKDVLYFLPCRC